jgi:adenine-specific DNA-methyltransferase
VIPVVKSSTGKMCACIYPYDKNGKLYPEETLREKSPMEYKWLCSHRERLETRKTEEPWYAFGRTQAIGDTYKDKWAVKSVVKSLGDIMPVKASAGIGVYGGLYILCDGPEQLECLKTKEFMSYVKSLRKYKSGGYYTFSSKDLENYLNWYNFNREK